LGRLFRPLEFELRISRPAFQPAGLPAGRSISKHRTVYFKAAGRDIFMAYKYNIL
jgi:hypothetical protein